MRKLLEKLTITSMILLSLNAFADSETIEISINNENLSCEEAELSIGYGVPLMIDYGKYETEEVEVTGTKFGHKNFAKEMYIFGNYSCEETMQKIIDGASDEGKVSVKKTVNLSVNLYPGTGGTTWEITDEKVRLHFSTEDGKKFYLESSEQSRKNLGVIEKEVK
jgi:hypothetical protein